MTRPPAIARRTAKRTMTGRLAGLRAWSLQRNLHGLDGHRDAASLPQAITLNGIAVNAARVIGPAIGGLVVRRARLGSVEIDDLTVRRLRVLKATPAMPENAGDE